MNTTEPTPWLCVTDYADTYGVDRSTVYKWMGAGILEIYRVDRVIRIKNMPPDLHRPPSTGVGAR